MNDTTKKPERQFAVVQNMSPLFDTAQMEHRQRVAAALANSTLLPEVVRGNNEKECFSNLLLVFDQAERWGMPPLAVAQSVGIVHGKMVFEGKLIAAVLEARMGIRLRYTWKGEPSDGDKFSITVTGKVDGEELSIEGTVGDWKTLDKSGAIQKNWKGNAARKQLAYRGSREWARLHTPGLMLGVYGDDEFDEYERRAGGSHVAAEKQQTISADFAAADDEDAPDAAPEPSQAQTVEDAEIEEPEPVDVANNQPPEDEPKAAKEEQPEPEPEPETKPVTKKKRGQRAVDAESTPDQDTVADGGIYKLGHSSALERRAKDASVYNALPEDSLVRKFIEWVNGQMGWAEIKAQFVANNQHPDWKQAAKPELMSLTRRMIMWRLHWLCTNGHKTPDLLEDLTLFRVWVEAQDDVEVIRERWVALCKSEILETASDRLQEMLTNVVTERIDDLEKGMST